MKNLLEFLISFIDLGSYKKLFDFLETMPHQEISSIEEVDQNFAKFDKE